MVSYLYYCCLYLIYHNRPVASCFGVVRPYYTEADSIRARSVEFFKPSKVSAVRKRSRSGHTYLILCCSGQERLTNKVGKVNRGNFGHGGISGHLVQTRKRSKASIFPTDML